MMDQVTLAERSYQLVRKDLGLEDELVFEGNDSAFDRLHDFLVRQINSLLDKDLGRLLNALYRIDIPEHKVKDILKHSDQGMIAVNLSRAIIEREKQKILTRLKYQTS